MAEEEEEKEKISYPTEKILCCQPPHDSPVFKECTVWIYALKVASVHDAHDVETIALQEGVCRFCFRMLKSEDNILKTKCRCPLTLMHTECADLQWPFSGATCGVCRRDIQIIRVTISITGIDTNLTPTEMRNKKKDGQQLKIDHQKPTPALKLRRQAPLHNPTPTPTRNDCCIL